MAVQPRDLPDILAEREASQWAVDRYGGLKAAYTDWHTNLQEQYDFYDGLRRSKGPDRKLITGEARVPDFIRLAAEDRSRAVAAARPNIICRPPSPGDKAQAAADKRERILSYWWDYNRLMQMCARWAFDAMFAGVTVAKVWPDPDPSKPPCYTRIRPLFCFPDPVFAEGPWLDSMVVSYEDNLRTIKAQYPDANIIIEPRDRNARGRCIEYFDGKQAVKVLRYVTSGNRTNEVTLYNVAHRLERTPIVIGTRATADNQYHGEFDNAVPLLEFAEQWAALMLDDAINKVYPERVTFDVEDAEEQGPGAEIRLESREGRYEYVQQPNQPFSNIQLFNQLIGGVRTSVMMPPARSGDPNESVISAAGINAAAGQWLAAVASTQIDVLAPMLEAANEIALRAEVAYYPNREKLIYGGFSKERETYRATKDIGDNYRNEVVYGSNSGLDPINRGVFALQQWAGGNGLISRHTAMEMNPAIQDVQRELKQQLVERLTEAGVAGLQQAAAAGQLPADVWANIVRAVTDDGIPLHEAVEKYMVVAPVAEPQGQAPTANPAAPGIAGAGEPQQPAQTLPPLETLIQI